ncbi:hypothetical protein [Paenibacillus sp. YN15]|uniref:hypothetical protein n=1 Tax=Paenibacillus sp. YN15 TaxID=1742774 RepID=UPI000DCD56E3|nr:hypothetical protein [Paenibacillus sp. YN15]RAU97149.1 hypothetical protein DQG13_19485 [Paenibacillus sp. YN15]
MSKKWLLWTALGLVLAAALSALAWRIIGENAASGAGEPLQVPPGFKQAETSLLTLAVPEGWSVEPNGKELIFTANGEKMGETETLDWFDAESWTHLRPNHTEQTDFVEVKDMPAPAAGQTGQSLYRIRLVHTKPAAQLDPDWHYDEIRWYWNDPGKRLTHGIYFNEAAVDEATMISVVSTIRLKAGR